MSGELEIRDSDAPRQYRRVDVEGLRVFWGGIDFFSVSCPLTVLSLGLCGVSIFAVPRKGAELFECRLC